MRPPQDRGATPWALLCLTGPEQALVQGTMQLPPEGHSQQMGSALMKLPYKGQVEALYCLS